MIPVTCPNCGRMHTYNACLAGLRVACKGCAAWVDVPSPGQRPGPAAPPRPSQPEPDIVILEATGPLTEEEEPVWAIPLVDPDPIVVQTPEPPPVPRRRFGPHLPRRRVVQVLGLLGGVLLLASMTPWKWFRGPGQYQTCEGMAGAVLVVAFSPDGTQVAAGGGAAVREENGKFDVRFTRDALADKSVWLWDVRSGKEVRRFGGHDDVVKVLAFSADGHRLLSGSGDTVRVWDARTGILQRKLADPGTGPLLGVAAADGNRILATNAQALYTWDGKTGRRLATLFYVLDPAGRFTVAESPLGQEFTFAPDGKRALARATTGLLHVLDVEEGRTNQTFQVPPRGACHVLFSDQGPHALWARNETTCLFQSLEAGTDLVELAMPMPWCSALSPDGRRLICGDNRGTVRLWELEGPKLLGQYQEHRGTVWSVAISPDGTFGASGGLDRVVRIWKFPEPGK